jgi:hypothetical protein
MRSTVLAALKEEETRNSYPLINTTPKNALASHPKDG